MSKPWRPERGRTSWLSPEAYRALSPREKRDLFAARSIEKTGRQVLARQNRHFAPTPARFRKGYYARRRRTWMAVVLAMSAVFGIVFESPWGSPPDAGAPGASSAPSAAIEWDAVQAPPTREISSEEAEWQARASSGGAAARAPSGPGRAGGVRVAFGACKWGGGTNCVVDGDTIYLAGAKIRIAGIDAPETHDYRCASELALGEQAAARLRQLVSGGAVTLSSIDRDHDVYGRLLRNVAVDGQDVGDVLVSEGLARPYAGGRRGWCD